MTDRLARIGVLTTASAFFGLWALLVYCETTRPMPLGVVVRAESDHVLVRGVVPGSAGDKAALRAGDRIVAADGRRISGRLDWTFLSSNLEFGRPIQLSIDRNSTLVTTAITPERAPLWQGWRQQHGPELLTIRTVQLVALIAALMVALKRPRDATALVGAVFLATVGVFSVTQPYRFAAVWRSLPVALSAPLWLPFMSSAAIAAWTLTFFAMFPRRRYPAPLIFAMWVPMVPGLAGQALFGYYTIIEGRPIPWNWPWGQMLLVVSSAYTVTAIVAVVRTYRALTDLNERRRVRIVMIGSLIGIAGGVPVLLTYWSLAEGDLDRLLFASRASTFGLFTFLALPLSFSYAILQHRLFDIDVMIRQGLRYMLARRALIGLVPVLAVLALLDVVSHDDQSLGAVARSHIWLYAGLTGAAIAVRSQQQRLLLALDRRFFRERYNAQRLLRQVAEDIRHATSVEQVAPTVVSRIEQALHPSLTALLVRLPDERRYSAIAVSPPSGGRVELDDANKVLSLARLVGKPLEITDSETGWLSRKLPIGDIRAVCQAGLSLVVPIAADVDMAPALLALGPKRSEEPYTDDDYELLMAIAESVALRLPGSAAPAASFAECPTCGECFESSTGRCPTDGVALAPVNAPRLLGGRYLLHRRIGRGGMGTVYASRDLSLDRRVAVKLMRDDLAALPEAADRFQHEARAAAAFSHPNVVTTHDFGVAGGRAYLVMEFLEGRTLRDVLRVEGRMAAARAVAVLHDVSAAVDAAHRRQLVHRDLKPENVCLVSDGSRERAKVVDFGIAKSLVRAEGDSHGSHGLGAIVLGTPLYMAPEQIRGETPDPSWDLWALAILAFEMLCGAHPFASVVPAGDTRIVETPADPRFANLPAGCQPFFARALAVDRARRPDSAARFLVDLESSLGA